MRRFSFLLILLVCPILVSAQVDTDFWFAVPYLVNAHDNSQQDGYGKLCITSFTDTTHVTITQPAVTRQNDPRYFAPMQFTLPPHTSVDIAVASGGINRAVQSGLCNYGINIVSDRHITAYYAQVNNNSEIYTLKGRNALGTLFLVAQQRQRGNAHGACASIEVLATEDNTQVHIQTPVTTYTNPTSTTITITLQRGQIYTVRAINASAANHLGGTIVTADKPVVVNSTDDSLADTGQDLIGEQIVPETLAGDEYIAISDANRTGLIDQLILYTFPSRPISYSVNGGAQQVLAGGSSVVINPTTAITHIIGSDKFVCYQVAGRGGELGGTVLPRLNCTGSREVVIKKRFNNQLLMLLTSPSNTGSFSINGQQVTIPFTVVPDAPNWVYAQVASGLFATDGIAHISNSAGTFHASIIDDGGGTFTYGYFSAYNSQAMVPVSSKSVYTAGDTIRLTLLDSVPFTGVSWTFPDGTVHSGASVYNIAIDSTDAGIYRVSGSSTDGCPLTQEDYPIRVEVVVPPTYKFDETLTLCDNDSALWHDSLWYKHLTEGVYHDTLVYKSHLGADSIYTLTLTVQPTRLTEETHVLALNDSVRCGSRWITYKGTETVEMYDTLQSVRGCDSVCHFVVHFQQTYDITQKDTVCYGTPYQWEDSVYLFLRGGIYTDFRHYHTAEYGADSILRLQLYVENLSIAGERLSAECGDTIHWHHRDSLDMLVIAPDTGGEITIVDTFFSTLGCVYYDTLFLTVSTPVIPQPTLQYRLLSNNIEACDGDNVFPVDFVRDEGQAHLCRVNYSDFDSILSLSDEMSIAVPLVPSLPDEYPVQITFIDTVHSLSCALAATLTMLYAPEKVFAQKWNNVLAVYSPDYTPYHLLFTAFRWYRNGILLNGENGSYLHLAHTEFEEGDYYQAEVTRSADGKTFITCPFYPQKPQYDKAPAAYWTILGIPTTTPQKGCYIMQQEDGQRVKIIVK